MDQRKRKWKLPSGLKDKDLNRLKELLELAESYHFKASAACSGHYAGAAVDAGDGHFVGGANVEYGGGFGVVGNRSFHAEESAIAAAVMAYGDDVKIRRVVVVSNAPTMVVPCGNCLDFLASYSDSEALLFGTTTSGEVKSFLFDEIFPLRFSRLDRCELNSKQSEALNCAIKSSEKGFDIYTRAILGKTGAAVLTESGRIYPGVRQDSSSFHPISAIEDAITTSRADSNPYISAIFCVVDKSTLSGRDRQQICERADELDEITTLPVFIYNVCTDTLERTTPTGLLPYGFGARELGKQEDVRRNLERYARTGNS